MARTCAFDVAAKTLIIVDGDGGGTEADWTALIDRMRRRGFDRVLIHTFGSPLPAKRRNELRAAVGDGDYRPAAMLIGSQLTLAVMSVLTMFIKNLKTLSPKDEAAALDFIKVPIAERPAVLASLKRLRDEVTLAVPPAKSA